MPGLGGKREARCSERALKGNDKMRSFKFNTFVLVGTAILLMTGVAVAQPRRGQFQSGVYKSRVAPRWFQDNNRFWYRNDLRGGAKEFVVVDVEAGARQPAFDHQRLAAALSKAVGQEYAAERLPFDEIDFIDDAKAIRFTAGDATWRCDLTTYECAKTDAPATPQTRNEAEQEGEERPGRRRLGGGGGGAGGSPRDGELGLRGARSPRSPDGKWT